MGLSLEPPSFRKRNESVEMVQEKQIQLDFHGYYKYSNLLSDKQNKSGIYCVYAGTDYPEAEKCTLRQLLYIGEAGDVYDRLINHEKLNEWKCFLEYGETLFISIAFIGKSDRKIAEAACIFKHKPPLNVEYVKNYPYEDVEIHISGEHSKLYSEFVVNKSC